MGPSTATEDYYLVLGIERTATVQEITSAYRRLALQTHPDRNAQPGATEAFQKLGKAYETLKDESKRRDYDLRFPSVPRARPSAQNAQAQPPPPRTSGAQMPSEEEQIEALEKAIQNRRKRWQAQCPRAGEQMGELARIIKQIKRQIKNLDNIIAAEAAAGAQKRTGGGSMGQQSPIYNDHGENEAEHASRRQQELKIERDMKDRKLRATKESLKEKKHAWTTGSAEVKAANRRDEERLKSLRDAREQRERSGYDQAPPRARNSQQPRPNYNTSQTWTSNTFTSYTWQDSGPNYFSQFTWQYWS